MWRSLSTDADAVTFHKMGVRVTLACTGIAFVATGAALHVGQAKTEDRGQVAAPQRPVALPISRESPLTFEPPVLICRFLVSTPLPQSEIVLQQFGSELGARIAELTDREITFVPPDARDGIGSIRFNDAHGRRWIVHTRLRVEMSDAFGNTSVLLQFTSANPITHEADPRQMTQGEFLVEWHAVRDAITLPITDAATEFDEIQGLLF